LHATAFFLWFFSADRDAILLDCHESPRPDSPPILTSDFWTFLRWPSPAHRRFVESGRVVLREFIPEARMWRRCFSFLQSTSDFFVSELLVERSVLASLFRWPSFLFQPASKALDPLGRAMTGRAGLFCWFAYFVCMRTLVFVQLFFVVIAEQALDGFTSFFFSRFRPEPLFPCFG